ncbi:MAG: hypothetical protein WC776_05100 [Patescibacteria group bacterium]|jgi:hypothetical protein
MTNTTLISDALYEEYSELLKTMKALEERKDALQTAIMDDMGANGLQQLKTNKATFSITATAKYKYSKVVTTLEEELKELKVTERTNGTATKEENPCLRVQLV